MHFSRNGLKYWIVQINIVIQIVADKDFSKRFVFVCENAYIKNIRDDVTNIGNIYSCRVPEQPQVINNMSILDKNNRRYVVILFV